MRTRRTVLAAFLVGAAPACVNDDPAMPVGGDLKPGFALQLPIDFIDEHPEALSIARETPAFGGLYFNDQRELVVALTDLSSLSHVERAIRPHAREPQHEGRHCKCIVGTRRRAPS